MYTPKWDIYINYEGDEYITRERQKDGSYKWREAYGYNLEAYSWYKHAWDEYVYISSEGSRQIQKLLGTKEKGFVGICKWQEGCKKRNEDKKIKKLTDQWDKDMEPIKDPPKGFKYAEKRSCTYPGQRKRNVFVQGNMRYPASRDIRRGWYREILRFGDLTTRMNVLSTDLNMVSVSIGGPLLQKRDGGHTFTRITAGGEYAGHWTGMRGLENTVKPCIGKTLARYSRNIIQHIRLL